MVTNETGSRTDTGNLDFVPPVEFGDDWDGNEPTCDFWEVTCTDAATNSITPRHFYHGAPEASHLHPPSFYCDRHFAVEIARILDVEVPATGDTVRHLVAEVNFHGTTYRVPEPTQPRGLGLVAG